MKDINTNKDKITVKKINSSAKLVSCTPNSKKVAFSAIRTCYSPHGFAHLWNKEYDKYCGKVGKDGSSDDAIRLIKHITSHNHMSTLEHIYFTFSCVMSRACLAQLSRHRHVSFSVQSQRYVNFGSEKGGIKYIGDMAGLDEMVLAAQGMYDKLLENNKAEDARSILPMCTACNAVVSMNLRTLLELKEKRGKHAQAEIRDLVGEMWNAACAENDWLNEVWGEEK